MELYNKYKAAMCVTEIEAPIYKAFREIWNFIKANNIDYREAELYCINCLQGCFAEEILRSAANQKVYEKLIAKQNELTQEAITWTTPNPRNTQAARSRSV
jgi:hypothetical protein